MPGHPRLILALGDSRIGGFAANRTGARFSTTITGAVPGTSLAKRWTIALDRFNLSAEFDLNDPWIDHTDIQNLQGTGTTLSYGALKSDTRLKPSGQQRYVIFCSGSGSQTSNQDAPQPLATWDPEADNGLWELYTEGYLIPALSVLPRPIEFGGLYITLGGGDSRFEDAANDYTDALTRILSGLEVILGISQIPCVGDLVPVNLDYNTYPYQDTVRTQQQVISSNITTGPLARVYFENSDHLPRLDAVHWTHDGALVAGINMNKRMIYEINPPGTEPIIT